MASVVQQSAAAWVKLANDNALWHKTRDQQRLNARGYRRDFNVGDDILVYVPPTAAEARRRGRKVKHMVWYNGPCTVTAVAGSKYTLKRKTTGQTYERTIGSCVASNTVVPRD